MDRQPNPARYTQPYHEEHLMRRKTLGTTLLTLALLATAAHASEYDCGTLENSLGPFDYNDPAMRLPTGENPMGQVKRVENVHFQPDMQFLNTRKFSPERLRGEFNYTLNAFPNHRIALNAMSRLEMLYSKQLPPLGKRYTADCYFDRAIRFRPEDKGVRFVYGMHLHQRGRLQDALKEYTLAETLGEDSGNFYYNYGLLHSDLKNWELAQKYAQKAYAAGVALPGLANKLQRNGHPITVTPAPAPAAPAAEPASDAGKTEQLPTEHSPAN